MSIEIVNERHNLGRRTETDRGTARRLKASADKCYDPEEGADHRGQE
ncbi:Uncharacterised protein [Mycobacteroides abscessus subsp. abscessus]|uniref:Uncharacterized protein n=2 Tax=Mycobacteroides abscessus TaxID=36809 RepID=A0AB33T7M2_9MYCO|nr:hypothetical protein I543_1071 [Mycobacteroides abscessus 21]MBE5494464.1 hypothetical protein [Mycobacteroides abscessus]SHO86182.1 Uncharacterised protein [Mycobacteroides abscessus subsp. abscessus]CPT40546.1 Uncharacterised protein [Mycobacteroides abscessus]CPT42213.1 Uncharacterised protein [Mycobacteroides abscessus]